MIEPQPTVGRIVHYVSRGSADGRFPSVCRATIVTTVDEHPEQNPDDTFIGLAVINPTGIFFEPVCIDSDENLPGTGTGPNASPLRLSRPPRAAASSALPTAD